MLDQRPVYQELYRLLELVPGQNHDDLCHRRWDVDAQRDVATIKARQEHLRNGRNNRKAFNQAVAEINARYDTQLWLVIVQFLTEIGRQDLLTVAASA